MRPQYLSLYNGVAGDPAAGPHPDVEPADDDNSTFPHLLWSLQPGASGWEQASCGGHAERSAPFPTRRPAGAAGGHCGEGEEQHQAGH